MLHRAAQPKTRTRALLWTAAGSLLLGPLPGCSFISDLGAGDSSSARSEAGPDERRAAQRSNERSNERAARPGEADRADDSTLRSTIRNGSAWSWVVSLRSGIKARSGTAVQNRVTGERVLIGPDQDATATVRRQPSWFVTERDRADEVIRVRVERRVETWSEPEVYWFEVLGPLPAQLTVTTPVREDGAVIPRLVGASPATPIAAVPKSRYPHEDR